MAMLPKKAVRTSSLIQDSKLGDAAHAIGQVEVFGEVKTEHPAEGEIQHNRE